MAETFSLGRERPPAMKNRGVDEQILRLASGRIVDCTDAKPFEIDESRKRLKDLPGWVLVSNSIQKEFRFKSYLRGLDFAYSLGKIAEQENHHPDLSIGWRRVKVVFSTHAIKGLSQNDFVMAAKSELEYSNYSDSQAP